MTRPPALAALLLAAALTVAACSVPGGRSPGAGRLRVVPLPLAAAPMPAAGEVSAEMSVGVPVGRASLKVRAAIPGAAPARAARMLLQFFQVSNHLDRSDIDHLVIKLYAWDGTTETQVALADMPARLLDSPITFSRLKGSTTYRARGFAYQAPGTAAGDLISVQDPSDYAQIDVYDDENLTFEMAPVPVRLAERPRLLVTSWAGAGGTGAVADDGTGTFADDSVSSLARFDTPRGLAIDSATGWVYVADRDNNRIRKISPAGQVTTLAGAGAWGAGDGATGATSLFGNPMAVAVSGSYVYVVELSQRVRRVNLATGATNTIAGSGNSGFLDATGSTAQFNEPSGIAIAGDGTLYVADRVNNRIRRVSTGAVVTTIAGGATADFVDGPGATARFNGPRGLALGPDGALYVADTGNNAIRRIELGAAGAKVTTVAGSGSPGHYDDEGVWAEFSAPEAVAITPNGRILVADTGNDVIRVIARNRMVRTIAGGSPGTAYDGAADVAGFYRPGGLALGPDGVLFVSDTWNHKVRRVL